jgi:hypothetical protein
MKHGGEEIKNFFKKKLYTFLRHDQNVHSQKNFKFRQQQQNLFTFFIFSLQTQHTQLD